MLTTTVPKNLKIIRTHKDPKYHENRLYDSDGSEGFFKETFEASREEPKQGRWAQTKNPKADAALPSRLTYLSWGKADGFGRLKTKTVSSEKEDSSPPKMTALTVLLEVDIAWSRAEEGKWRTTPSRDGSWRNCRTLAILVDAESRLSSVRWRREIRSWLAFSFSSSSSSSTSAGPSSQNLNPVKEELQELKRLKNLSELTASPTSFVPSSSSWMSKDLRLGKEAPRKRSCPQRYTEDESRR